MRNLIRANFWYWTHSVPMWLAYIAALALGAANAATAVHISDRTPDMPLFIPQYSFSIGALLLFLACLVLISGKERSHVDLRNKLIAGYSRNMVCAAEIITAAFHACAVCLLNMLPTLIAALPFRAYLDAKTVCCGMLCQMLAFTAMSTVIVWLTAAFDNQPMNMMLVFLGVPAILMLYNVTGNLGDSKLIAAKALLYCNVIYPIEECYNTIMCNTINGVTGEFMGNHASTRNLSLAIPYQLVLLAALLLLTLLRYRRKNIK